MYKQKYKEGQQIHKDIYLYICRYIKEHRYAPSYRDCRRCRCVKCHGASPHGHAANGWIDRNGSPEDTESVPVDRI